MMIAGSPDLRDLHDKAYQWLVSHGHEAEANALLRRDKGAGKKQGKTSPPKHKRAGSKSQSGKTQKKSGSQPGSKGYPWEHEMSVSCSHDNVPFISYSLWSSCLYAKINPFTLHPPSRREVPITCLQYNPGNITVR